MVPVIIHRLAGGGGDHLIFGRTKGGSVLTENPKGGSLKTLEGFRGGNHSNLLGKMKTCGGGGDRRESSKVIRGDHFSDVTSKGGIG